MTREDKQSVISICRILADKMDDSGQIAVQNVISAVERMKEQEQNLDAINRQTAIKTINSWLSCDDYNEAEREIMRAARSMLLGLPSVTPNQKQERITDDAISRRAVLKLFATHDGKYLFEAIRDLPSVTPQEPKTGTGHWIKTISENGITSAVRCSECGFEDNRYMLFRYCPNCGAKMVEPQESEDKCKSCKYSRNPDYTRCHDCNAESEE